MVRERSPEEKGGITEKREGRRFRPSLKTRVRPAVERIAEWSYSGLRKLTPKMRTK